MAQHGEAIWSEAIALTVKIFAIDLAVRLTDIIVMGNAI
jgi:hypothetical protein